MRNFILTVAAVLIVIVAVAIVAYAIWLPIAAIGNL